MKTEQNFKFNKFAAKIAKKREITRKILARKQKRGNLTFLIRNKTLSRLDFKEQTKSGVCLKDISPREIQYGTPMARYSDKNFSSPTLKVNNENIDRTPKRMKVTRERKNELPPLHSTAEKKKDARLSQGQIHLKSFASFKNTSCNEKAPDSEIESKRDSELEESHRLEINNNFEKVSTATPSNTKTKTTKRNSVKVLIPLSRKKTHYTQTSSMNKTKKTNLPQLSVQSESNLTIKEGTLEKDSQEDSIIMLKDLMEKELTKAEKEIESFGKEFENLVES